MTENKMPDFVYLEPKPATWGAMLMSEHPQKSATKYLRAEPVEALLKQAIYAILSTDRDFKIKTITAITDFLGEKK